MFKLASLLLLAGVVAAGSCNRSAGKRDERADAKPLPRPKFTIGKETTYVDGPVDDEGYIDYAAALNERMRKGVTPENNAYVLICKALGPHPEGGTMPAAFYELLGIDQPPERGDYFVDMGRRVQQADEFLHEVTARVWKAEDNPQIVAWLNANEKPLAVITEATKRPHYYYPLVARPTKHGPAGMLMSLLPGVQVCRSVARALAARAMLHLDEGRPAEAWRDLLACHRLGRLVGRGGSVIEGFAGYAIDTLACRADLAFLEGAELSATRLKECLRDLQQLPSHIHVAEKVAVSERCILLDTLMMLNRYGPNSLGSGASSKAPESAADRFFRTIDWDPALRGANRWYDRLETALRIRECKKRDNALSSLEVEVKKKTAAIGDRRDLMNSIRGFAATPREGLMPSPDNVHPFTELT